METIPFRKALPSCSKINSKGPIPSTLEVRISIHRFWGNRNVQTIAEVKHQTITEAEILQAIHRPLGAKSVDGVKRRVRAGMGRCQAGFCTPKTMELIAKEWNVPVEDIVKSGRGSHVL